MDYHGLSWTIIDYHGLSLVHDSPELDVDPGIDDSVTTHQASAPSVVKRHCVI